MLKLLQKKTYFRSFRIILDDFMLHGITYTIINRLFAELVMCSPCMARNFRHLGFNQFIFLLFLMYT